MEIEEELNDVKEELGNIIYLLNNVEGNYNWLQSRLHTLKKNVLYIIKQNELNNNK